MIYPSHAHEAQATKRRSGGVRGYANPTESAPSDFPWLPPVFGPLAWKVLASMLLFYVGRALSDTQRVR